MPEQLTPEEARQELARRRAANGGQRQAPRRLGGLPQSAASGFAAPSIDEARRIAGSQPVPSLDEAEASTRERLAQEAGQRAARDYSPLPDELGWVVPPAAWAGDVGGSVVDAGLAAMGDDTAARRRDARTDRWSRGAEQASQDLMDDEAGGKLLRFFEDLPEQMRQAEAQRVGAGGDPSIIGQAGALARGLWMGWPEAGRDARYRAAYNDARADQQRADYRDAFERGGYDEDGMLATPWGERVSRNEADRALGDDFWITGPAALEFVPEIGLVHGLTRFGARQGLRAAGQGAPEMLARPEYLSETQSLGARTGEVNPRTGEDVLYSATGNARGWRNNAAVGAGVFAGADAIDGEMGDDPLASAITAGGAVALGRRLIPSQDTAIPAEIQALARQGELSPGGQRTYRPGDNQVVTVNPDGRVVMSYSGGYHPGGGTATEARDVMRGTLGALEDDIATTRRSEYNWTPTNERLGRFYRGTIGERPPTNYAFSETPEGVQRLRRLGAQFDDEAAPAAPASDSAAGGRRTISGPGGSIEVEVQPDGWHMVATNFDEGAMADGRAAQLYMQLERQAQEAGAQVLAGRRHARNSARLGEVAPPEAQAVRHGEQLNLRDGSVTPATRIDPEAADIRLYDDYAGTIGTPPRSDMEGVYAEGPSDGMPRRLGGSGPDAGSGSAGQFERVNGGIGYHSRQFMRGDGAGFPDEGIDIQGVTPTRERVAIESLTPTQLRLSDNFNDPARPRRAGEAFDGMPAVYRRGGDVFVLDGHHRMAEAAARGETHIEVLVFDSANGARPMARTANTFEAATDWSGVDGVSAARVAAQHRLSEQAAIALVERARRGERLSDRNRQIIRDMIAADRADQSVNPNGGGALAQVLRGRNAPDGGPSPSIDAPTAGGANSRRGNAPDAGDEGIFAPGPRGGTPRRRRLGEVTEELTAPVNSVRTTNEPTEYAVQSYGRILAAAEKIARDNGGSIPIGGLDRLAVETGYDSPRTLSVILSNMRAGVFGPELQARARAIPVAVGRERVNFAFIENMMNNGYERQPRVIHERLNAYRTERGLEPSPLESVRQAMSRIRAARRQRGEQVGAAAGAVGLGGAALLWGEEAQAQDALGDGRVLEPLPEEDIREGNWVSEWSRTTLSDGTPALMRAWQSPEGEEYTIIGVQNDRGDISNLGVVRPTDGAPGRSMRLGEGQGRVISEGVTDADMPYLPPAEQRSSAWPETMRILGSGGMGLIARNTAVRMGLRGLAQDLPAAGVALGVNQLTGGDGVEGAAVALATPAFGRVAEYAAPRLGAMIDQGLEQQATRSMVWTERDHALASDPAHLARSREFAMTLPGDAPRVRATVTENYHGDVMRDAEGRAPLSVPDTEMAEQGFARDLPGTQTSARDEFLALRPEQQEAWMERQFFELSAPSERVNAGADMQRRLGRSATTTPQITAPTDSAPQRGMPPMNRRTRGERTGPAVVRRAGTRRAKDTMGGFIEAARAQGVDIPPGRTKAETGRNIAEAVKANPSLEQLARDWGLAALLAVGVGGVLANEAEAGTGGDADDGLSLEEALSIGGGGATIAAAAPVVSRFMRSPAAARLGDMSEVSSLPFAATSDVPMLARRGARLGMKAENPEAILAGGYGGAAAVGAGTALALDPITTTGPEAWRQQYEREMAFDAGADLRTTALRLVMQGVRSTEVEDPALAAEMRDLEILMGERNVPRRLGVAASPAQ